MTIAAWPRSVSKPRISYGRSPNGRERGNGAAIRGETGDRKPPCRAGERSRRRARKRRTCGRGPASKPPPDDPGLRSGPDPTPNRQIPRASFRRPARAAIRRNRAAGRPGPAPRRRPSRTPRTLTHDRRHGGRRHRHRRRDRQDSRIQRGGRAPVRLSGRGRDRAQRAHIDGPVRRRVARHLHRQLPQNRKGLHHRRRPRARGQAPGRLDLSDPSDDQPSGTRWRPSVYGDHPRHHRSKAGRGRAPAKRANAARTVRQQPGPGRPSRSGRHRQLRQRGVEEVRQGNRGHRSRRRPGQRLFGSLRKHLGRRCEVDRGRPEVAPERGQGFARFDLRAPIAGSGSLVPVGGAAHFRRTGRRGDGDAYRHHRHGPDRTRPRRGDGDARKRPRPRTAPSRNSCRA